MHTDNGLTALNVYAAVPDHGTLQLVVDASRAGGGLVTINVSSHDTSDGRTRREMTGDS